MAHTTGHDPLTGAGLLTWLSRLAAVTGSDRPAPGWYRGRSHPVVAMTPRLDEQMFHALRQRAAREGRSMQDVARQAVRDYIERTSKREALDGVLGEEIPRYAEALRRLGE